MQSETKAEPVRAKRKYGRAPITEAIIEIRVKPAAGVTGQSCKDVLDEVRSDFPDAMALMQLQAAILTGSQVGAQATQTMGGSARASPAKHQIVTATPDRFAFSQLPPYDEWETFCPAARRLWDLYASRLKPDAITRVATRFVNRIELPLPVTDLTRYFRTVPVISPRMPQTALGGAFMQLQLPQNDLACLVILNVAILPASETTWPVILDIDIGDEAEISPVDDKRIWARLEELRWRKNDIFEACITDEVRELIS